MLDDAITKCYDVIITCSIRQMKSFYLEIRYSLYILEPIEEGEGKISPSGLHRVNAREKES